VSDPHASHHDDHDAHPHPAPSVPLTVKDEAGDTPTWVPVVGLALLALLGLFVVYRAANPSGDAANAAAADGAVVDGASDGGAPAEPAAEPAAAPH
jgi:hypothetical protein